MESNLDEMLAEAPTLTLDPQIAVAVPQTNEEIAVVPTGAQTAVAAGTQAAGSSAASAEEPQIELTPEEQKMVDDVASQIDLSNTQQVMQYGAATQKKLADFSENALSSVQTKDLGEVGQMLTDVVSQLRSFDDGEDQKGLKGFFKKNANKVANYRAKYESAEANIDKISAGLEQHQVTLLKDVAMLDKMYQLNLNYYKELSMYILAGKKKLAEAREKELPAMREKAQKSGLPEDAQAAKDYADLCDRFDKKIYDLELSKTVSMQMAPQIRLIQNNDTMMSDKIQSTLVNTIPLWKNQMVLAIGLSHSTEAARVQHEVSDMTNELLKKNADTLKMASVETAKESERGIVDIETLTATNQTLISTLDEVLKIQEDGKQKRAAAEVELQRIENEMKNKLQEFSAK